jgi:hypothetical protein
MQKPRGPGVFFDEAKGLNDMEKTLRVINSMVADGIIEKYAIGGAVAATYYLEPAATLDLDIFISLPKEGALVSLQPIYEYLKDRGYREQNEFILIEGWPVQFLPAGNALVEEALQNAIPAELSGTPTRIMKAEHLAAIALQLGRTKDFLRVLQFVEQGVLDSKRFTDILERFGLLEYWRRFSDRYLH